jgi:hypothetical protein
MIRQLILSCPALGFCAKILLSVGKRKAIVLPVPVLALASKSAPVRAGPRVAAWTSLISGKGMAESNLGSTRSLRLAKGTVERWVDTVGATSVRSS